METHNSEELAHYGVLGMKWGVRKQPENSTGSAIKSKAEKDKIAADRVAAAQAKLDRKNAEKAAKKVSSAAKKAASGVKKAASGAKKAASGAKKAASAARQKISKASADHAQKRAEAARKKLENQKLREVRKAEQDRKKKQRDAERAQKQHERDEKKKAKEAEKQAKLEKYATTPKGGLTREQRKALPKNLATTDLIEQNKRLQLEKTNSELKAKLAEYEKENRSQFAKLADTFVSEASSNLTKYAAKKASDMLIGAIDSNLSVGNIKSLAKEADRATGLSEVIKKKDKK